MHNNKEISGKARLHEANRATWWGLAVNILLTAFKFFAGIVGKSQAMLADAVHSLSDLLSDIVTFIGVNMGAKPSDEDHQYGHGKIETMSLAVIGLILFFVGVRICWKGVEEISLLLHGNIPEAPSVIALVAAIVSILSKEILYQYTIRIAKKINSTVLVANAWHHRTDALSSIAVLIGIAGAMFLGVSWRILDPVAAILVSLFIGKVAIDMIRNACSELMERALPSETEEKILRIASGVDKLSKPHHLKTRRIGHTVAIDMHICVAPEMSVREAHHLVEQVELSLHKEFGDEAHISIHIEPEGEDE